MNLPINNFICLSCYHAEKWHNIVNEELHCQAWVTTSETLSRSLTGAGLAYTVCECTCFRMDNLKYMEAVYAAQGEQHD